MSGLTLRKEGKGGERERERGVERDMVADGC